jgi:hypothetical protein
MKRRRAAGPVADGDEVGSVDLGDGEEHVPVEDPEAGRLVGQPGQPLELGQRDPAQVERALGPFGEADDDQPQPVLAGLVVLFDEAPLLECREEPRRGGLVEPEAARQLGHTRLTLALAEGEQEGGGSIDRPDRVTVEDHRRQPPVGCDSAPVGSAAGWPCARASSAKSRASLNVVTILSTMSPCACASQMNHGSRESGSHRMSSSCSTFATASYKAPREFIWITGVLLFIGRATTWGLAIPFFIKMAFVIASAATMMPLRSYVLHSDPQQREPDGNARLLAIASILTWTGAITAGRLLAYLVP